jgi:hypothetical protein
MWEKARLAGGLPSDRPIRRVRDRARTKLIELARRFASRLDPDRFFELVGSLQEIRTSVEEVQTALLHLTSLPSRYDVRKAHRRVLALRRRARELDLALARLESIAARVTRIPGSGA